MQHVPWDGMRRRTVLLAPLAALFGCASPSILKDGQPTAAGQAHILVHPHYRYGSGSYKEVDIGLTRVEGKSTTDLQLVAVPTDEVSILEVPPGFYYLRRVEIDRGYHRHTIDPRMTLFNAKTGQINYPGDWNINVQVLAADIKGTVARGSISTDYGIRISVVEDPKVAAKLQTKYPALNAAYPLRATRVVES